MTFDEWLKGPAFGLGVAWMTAREAARLAFDAATEAEREDCAKVVEEFKHWIGRQAKYEIAAAIRARSNAAPEYGK